MADKAPMRNIVRIKKSGSAIFKEYMPITPSLRQRRVPFSPHLYKGKAVRALTVAKRSTGGRNNTGRITTRARGGGHKRRLRLVDFTRLEAGEQTVLRIEYDPNRSAHLALLQHNETKAVSYILAPASLRAGDVVRSYRSGLPSNFTMSTYSESPATSVLEQEDPEPAPFRPRKPGEQQQQTSAEQPQTVNPPKVDKEEVDKEEVDKFEAREDASQQEASSRQPDNPEVQTSVDLGMLRAVALKTGNVLAIRYIPIGTVVHAITLSPSGPAILARSAGSSARIISQASPNGKNAQVRLSSGEVRYVNLNCFATIGSVSNPDHQHENLGKAGRMRWLGFRPQSRGVAMNATDHPMGGGRGKSKGNRPPRDQFFNYAKGGRTRRPKSKNGNKMVIKERPRVSSTLPRNVQADTHHMMSRVPKSHQDVRIVRRSFCMHPLGTARLLDPTSRLSAET